MAQCKFAFWLQPSYRWWRKSAIRLLIVVSTLLLSTPPVRADTTLCGALTGDTTWTPAGNAYIVTCDVQVVTGVTLTIEPGVIVKFNQNTGLRVDGTLVARGATFTKNQSGNWKHILFTASSTDAVFDANGAYLSGSILQGSVVEGGGQGVNGGVEAVSTSPWIDQNTIRNHIASGIHATARSSSQPIVLSSNSVSHNERSGAGGGIHIVAGRVISNTIDNNQAVFVRGNNGGGIYASDSTLINNLVSNNYAYVSGGGIYAAGSTLISNTVSGNHADRSHGGGIYITGGSLEGNKVSGNTSAVQGGGIYAQGGTLTNNSITGNSSQDDGGGIFASSSTVTGNTVTDNVANENGDGGGIYAQGGTISGNTISGNSTVGGTTNLGGGLFIAGGSAEQNTITNNSAKRGGGIYGDNANLRNNILTTNQATEDGGGIYAFNKTTGTENTLRENTAAQGGGFYSNNANVTGNRVENNQANFGAGIYALKSTVRGNTVTSNDAQSDGGGLYLSGGVANGNWISSNTVPSFGGGVGVYITGTVEFSNNSVVTNTTAGGTAGGITVHGQPTRLEYNNLYGNQPYDAEVVSASEIKGTLNYWGNVPCTAIAGHIYDGLDAPGRGTFLYAPSFYTPVPVAQVPTVTGLAIISDTTSATLTWNPHAALPDVGCDPNYQNPPDLAYRIYYDTDAAGPPYTGQGLPSGASPIDVGTATSLSFPTLPANKDYHFVVAAYDYLGRESAYSHEVVKPCTNSPCTIPPTTPQPLVLLYAVLDNNLGDDPETWERLVNNAEAGVHAGVNVRLLIDGPGTEDAYVYDLQPDTDPHCPRLGNHTCGGRYSAANNNFKTWDENTAHPYSLRNFVTETITSHAGASPIILALIGHGSGWSANALPDQPSAWKKQPSDVEEHTEQIGGLLWDDETDKDGTNLSTSRSLSTKALGFALAEVKRITDHSIDLLYLDACSMGMTEVAYEVSDSVSYLLASPNTDWASFAYKEMLKEVSSKRPILDIGQAWLAAEANVLKREEYPFTLALYNLSQSAALSNTMNTLSLALSADITTTKPLLTVVLSNTERFESDYNGIIDTRDSYADLQSLLLRLEQQPSLAPNITIAIQAVKSALTAFVVDQRLHSGRPWLYPNHEWRWLEAKGLSIYLPLLTDEPKRTLYTAGNLQWAQATAWDDLLDAYWQTNHTQAAAQVDLPICKSTRDCGVKPATPLPLLAMLYLPVVRK